MQPAISKSSSEADRLKTILESDIHDTTRISVSAKLARIYIDQKLITEAEGLIQDGFDLAKEKEINTPFLLHWAMAELHFNHRDNHKGLEEMDIVLEKVGEDGNPETIAMANNFVGLLYFYSGRFSESIQKYTENIEYIKANKLVKILPEAYSGLGYLYNYLGDVEEKRKNLVLMADASIKAENVKLCANAYLRLGDIGMMEDSNFTYAIEQYKKSLDYYKEMTDTAGVAFLLLRIGWNHYLNDELHTALDYFFYSLEYSIPTDILRSITNAYGNIGTIYRDQKEYTKAIKYYKKSIEYSHKAEDWYNLSWLYKDISMMDTAQGDFETAYNNHVLHKKYSDSLEMQKYNRGIADARGRYEAERSEKELELISLKLEQQKYLTYGFAGLIFLFLIIGLLIFRSTRISSKRRISEMNHKISEITQKNLRQQMNPHFIFNTLNSIQYYMYQHDKISTNNYLTKFSSLMRKTLENSQHTSITIKDELDALELYLELEALRFKEKFEYTLKVDDDIDTLLLKIPTMLIQPYVENAICHGLVHKESKGYVHIELKLDEDRVRCIVEDNGIGRKAAMKINKQTNGNHNSLGTKITESRLKLVNSLYGKNMRIDYTDIENEKGNGIGTRVVIHIPIMT